MKMRTVVAVLALTAALALSGGRAAAATPPANHVPAVAIVSPVPNTSTFDIAEPATVWAVFTDADLLDRHTCSINWGDTTTTAGAVLEVLGVGACRASHTYSTTGPHNVILTVTDQRGATRTAAVTVTSRKLAIGTRGLAGTGNDTNAAGRAEAFQATATATGTAVSVSVYIDLLNTAQKLVAGIYANNAGHPGALLGQGTISGLFPASFNTVVVPGVALTAGTPYWITILQPAGTSGTLRFRDHAGHEHASDPPSEHSLQSNLTTLPSSWQRGTVFPHRGPLVAWGGLVAAVVTPTADLSISKTDGTASAAPGTTTTYTVVVSNSATSSTSSAAVHDVMPAGIASDTWTAVASAGSSLTASSGTGDIDTSVTLQPGGTATFTVVASIRSSATGTLTNTVTVAAPSGVIDPDLTNNSASDADTLTPRADLAVVKTDGTTSAVPGAATTYTVVVSNNGPSTAVGAAVHDVMPAELTSDAWSAVASPGSSVASSSGTGDIDTTVTLLPGGTATFTVSGSIDPSATGTLTNTAAVSAPSGVTDPDTSNNSASDADTLTPVADLSIAKTDGTADVVAGTSTTYTIVVTNGGPSVATGAAVNDVMPTAVSATWTATASTGSSVAASSGSGNIATMVTLLPGGTATFTVVAAVSHSATGTLTNTATVAAPAGVTDNDLTDNSATDADAIGPAPPSGAAILVVTNGSDAVSDAGVSAIQSLGDYSVTVARDPGQIAAELTPASLAGYRAVVFLDTGGTFGLTAGQEAAFEQYFHAGGGFLGIGSAIESDPSWQFYTDILGTRSSNVTAVQSATVKVFDRVHDATKDLPEYWDRTDAWYNFTSNVRGVSHVLATVVEDPFGPQPQGQVLDGIAGGTMGADHPVVWCKDYQGGRSFYTAGGNTAASFSETAFKTHLDGALNWATGQADAHTSDCGATVLSNFRQVKVSAPPDLGEPIGFDQLPDGRIVQTSRRGVVSLHDPANGSAQTIADLPVYMNAEDGLYGPAIDNNFTTDHWVYLYYAPLVADNITYSDGTTGHTNDFSAPPFVNGTAPTQAVNLSDFDPWIGYFQLSRFKFVDAAPGVTAHLDLSSEQQIMRVPNNRGACCNVAGDIDFDTHNNLWLVTGDDSAAGSGDAGAWGQSIDQKTDENQTIRISAGTTGGTFTLTFNGQTTAPIAFNANAAAIAAALGALSNIGTANIQATGGPVNTANVLATWKGSFEEQDVSSLTSDATGLTGTTPTVTIGVGVGAGGSNTTARQGGLWRMPAADAARSALNTNDLRGKVLRIHVNDADITSADSNKLDIGSGGAYTVPASNLFPLVAGVPQLKTRPEVYAMGLRNPFRIQVDENDVAYVSDYSPDSQTPQQFHGPPGVGRYAVVRQPGNYGWPYCMKPDLPEYPWNVNLQVPMDAATHQPTASPQPYSCAGATVPNNDYWNVNGGPSVEPGLTATPGLTAPDVWYSYRDNTPAAPLGTPCFDYYGPDALTLPPVPGSTTPCPRLFPELYTGGVGPHGMAKYHYDPANPNPSKFPPYYNDSIVLGEFTQDTLRELKLDSQNRVFKINPLLNCGQANLPSSPFPFECDNPMDLQWGADGELYLLTYGDGFFNINPDAGLYRWEYVKGQRPPVAMASANVTNGALPLTVNFSSAGSRTPEQGESISFDWNFGDGSPHSTDPNPSHTYANPCSCTVVLTVTASSGKSDTASLVITAGNTAPTVVVTTPVDGGTFDLGNDIPFTVTVTDPEDGPIDCTQVNVTFVLGHDTHGHAEDSTTGCAGVLHTVAGDVTHGGHLFGVISATYTDHGGTGAPTLSTTGQSAIRLKQQEVEFAVNQSGTNTATNNDGGLSSGPPGNPGVHRSSLANGDWIQLNGPFNLLNITDITFRVSDTSTRTAGSPMAAIELHQDTLTGPIVDTYNLVSTGNATTWTSQNFPISLSGTHELFLVFRAVTGGQTGANLLNLNWAEFGGGSGIGSP